jgi:hypothetical protein
VLIFWRRAEQHHQAADQLHACRAQVVGNLAKHLLAFLARQGRCAHFDQLVRRERPVDFLHHGLGQAIGTDQHDRFTMMRFGLQAQPLVAG